MRSSWRRGAFVHLCLDSHTDGTAKLSGRDCEIREPIPRRDQAVRRIYRHHNAPRVQLCVPGEETFPIPLKYIDATRSTHTDLDVMQEKRIDDYCNIDLNRSLSDPWKGFAKFALLKEKPSKGYLCGPG